MVKRKVKLVNISDVESFNAICSKFDCDMDLSSGKYYVNAKSIMGIFALGLEHLLTVNCHGENPEFRQSIGKFAQEA